MGEKVQVVAAIIERGGRLLFGKRSPQRLAAPGYWCPVSGRIEPGESQAEAVVREVREEVGLSVRALQKVDECDTHDGSALIHWWRAEPLDDAPAQLLGDEHTELRWVTLEEMRSLEPAFAEDVEIIARAVGQSQGSSGAGSPAPGRREMLKLRPATASDEVFLRDLHHLAYRDVVLRQFGAWEEAAQDFWFERSLEEAVFQVIEREQLAVGALGTKEEPTRLDIVELQVLPDWQNQGIGTFVIVAELERARVSGKPVQLRVLKQNRAQRLYQRHGFVVTGETEAHYLMRRTWP